jgi:trigger factor
MKVTQEKLPQSRIGLEIEIPPDQSKNAYEQVVQKLARTVNIPGFRKGKVPRQILLQQLGQTRIKATALEELIQSSLQQALKQEAIEPLGNYQLRSDFDELVGQFKPGEPLTFIAAVDVQPEVSLGDYTGLTVKAEEVPYDPSTVEKFLEERRAELANLIPVEGRPAQMGDVAVVDYSSRLADEPEGEETESIAGGQAEDAQIELVEGKFLKEFVDGMWA